MKYATVPTELQDRASFAVRVKGNSLEPVYRDGDLLLVEETDAPRHGDLGVFYPKGSGRGTWWIRRYKEKDGQRRIVSLNADIDPAPVTHDLVYKGRVIGRVEKEAASCQSKRHTAKVRCASAQMGDGSTASM